MSPDIVIMPGMTTEDEARVREIVREEAGSGYKPIPSFPIPDGVTICSDGYAVRADGSRYVPPPAD
jgi:hypothetical protein